ncbi:MAG TPA: ABC transporter permease subunit [Verrucomicrobiae bacterium]|jgi:ABC-type transport system involved in multi-copper enzyme maturation permease subunit|nr:ABC transporter permease subunit [Verrucomicrobiae bacterium]
MNVIFAVAGVVIKEMYRRKDFYVLLILTVVITLLMGSINFFDDDKIARYLKEVCLMLIWVSSLVIAISTVARQLPMEKENRTIFPLLAKPISRAQLVTGKFLGCWLACGVALLCFYVFFGCLSFSRERHWFLLNYFQAATLHWAMLAIIIGMALLGSLVFAAPSSNGTICFVLVAGILLIGGYLNRVAMQTTEPGRSFVYAIYYIIPHLEIFNVQERMVHDWPLIEWKYYALAILYAAAYSAVFVFFSCRLFRRKALS